MCCTYVAYVVLFFFLEEDILNYPKIIYPLCGSNTKINDDGAYCHLLCRCPSDLVIKKNKHSLLQKKLYFLHIKKYFSYYFFLNVKRVDSMTSQILKIKHLDNFSFVITFFDIKNHMCGLF